MEKLLTLKERLNEWLDFDRAAYELGVVLGLFPEFGSQDSDDPWNGMKRVFRSGNPLEDGLAVMFNHLVSAGMLEYQESEDRYRWNSQYRVKL